MTTVASQQTPEILQSLNSAWHVAQDVLPNVLPHDFYGNDHSEPVQVVVERDGKVSVSPMTWSYSFRKRGWVCADLADGLEPSSYTSYGRVLAWCPMQSLH